MGTRQARAIDSGRPVRRTDDEFLTSAVALDLLRRYDIPLIDYRVIQRAWTRSRPRRST
ncbi:hypothetical protein ABT352_15335 [Streptosporangium sp. NPDC000563]|uniref:hypothetical protein n=1 Tax=Streptosporangium sp. NPDC000563 TaxID=3154366 RepID=UPI0033296534